MRAACVWTTKIGPNKYSSPVLVDGKIFVVADPALLFCVNAADGLAVLADREKLEQVLINLLGNAVKFTPAGGRITLSASDRGDRIALQVQDTGIGIEPWQMGTIFEPFVQLEPSLTRTTEGAGLGLAISRELTRGMGGEISVASVPGEGSVFTVELPRAAAGDHFVG